MALPSKILVAVDFSPGSEASVEYAVVLAKALHSTLTLLHVYQLPDLMESIVPGADPGADAENNRMFAQHGLEKIRGEVRKHTDVEIRVVAVHGSPPGDIVSFSHKEGFDMIIMGTHGRTGLRRVLMGSVAEAVVRGARCPVLTVHLPFVHEEDDLRA